MRFALCESAISHSRVSDLRYVDGANGLVRGGITLAHLMILFFLLAAAMIRWGKPKCAAKLLITGLLVWTILILVGRWSIRSIGVRGLSRR